VTRLAPGSADELEHRARLGRWLAAAVPRLAPVDLVALIETATGARVALTSHGATAGAKRWR
jgi:hypothetical protein